MVDFVNVVVNVRVVIVVFGDVVVDDVVDVVIFVLVVDVLDVEGEVNEFVNIMLKDFAIDVSPCALISQQFPASSYITLHIRSLTVVLIVIYPVMKAFVTVSCSGEVILVKLFPSKQTKQMKYSNSICLDNITLRQ